MLLFLNYRNIVTLLISCVGLAKHMPKAIFAGSNFEIFENKLSGLRKAPVTQNALLKSLGDH